MKPVKNTLKLRSRFQRGDFLKFAEHYSCTYEVMVPFSTPCRNNHTNCVNKHMFSRLYCISLDSFCDYCVGNTNNWIKIGGEELRMRSSR